MKTLSISLLAAAALGLSAAHAQEPPRGGAPGGFAARHAEMQQQREAMQRQHAADLRTILRLRPDQEGALQAFLTASHPPMGGHDMRRERRDPNAGPETTPQRLDDMARRQAEMGQMMERRRQAVATFYAELAPDQRAVFDALQRMHGHGGHGMHGGPGGFGGHGMHGKDGPPPRD